MSDHTALLEDQSLTLIQREWRIEQDDRINLENFISPHPIIHIATQRCYKKVEYIGENLSALYPDSESEDADTLESETMTESSLTEKSVFDFIDEDWLENNKMKRDARMINLFEIWNAPKSSFQADQAFDLLRNEVEPMKEIYEGIYRFQFVDIRSDQLEDTEYHITVALHDFNSAMKISEDFCTIHKPEMLDSFIIEKSDPALMINKCLFRVLKKSRDIHLVFKISKIRKELTDIYKDENILFLEPLYYAATRFFDDTKGHPSTIYKLISAKSIVENEFYEIISQCLYSPDDKKIKHVTVPVNLELSIQQFSINSVPLVIDTSLNRVQPFLDKFLEVHDKTLLSKVMREVHSFEDRIPHIDYVNNFYISPKHVETVQLAPRSLQILVSYRNGSLEEIPIVYGKTFAPKFMKKGATDISENQDFRGEIKMKIPLEVSPNDHMYFQLFTFDQKKNRKRKLVGEAFYEIQSTGLFQSHRPISIPFYERIEEKYLDGIIEYPEKGTITFSVGMNSSLHSSEYHVQNLLSLPYEEESLFLRKRYLKEIVDSSKINLEKNFPAIVLKLLKFITFEETENIVECVTSITSILQYLLSIGYEHQIQSFITYTFDLDYLEEKSLYRPLTKHFLQILKTQNLRKNSPAWCFFSIILKSMILYKEELGETNDIFRNDSAFVADLLAILDLFLFTYDNPSMLSNTFSFFRALIPILGLTILEPTINKFMYEDDEMKNMIKIDMMKALCEYEQFSLLNNPQLDTTSKIIASSNDVEELKSKYIEAYPVVSHMLYHLECTYDFSDFKRSSFSRLKVIEVMRNLFRNQELDQRLDSKSLRTAIADMFFPFLHYSVKTISPALNIFNLPEKMEWLLSFVYLLRYCSDELFTKWMRMETLKQRHLFFIMLDEITESLKDTHLYFQASITSMNVLADFVVACQEDLNQKASGTIVSKIVYIYKRFLVSRDQRLVGFACDSILHLIDYCPGGLFPNNTSSEGTDLLTEELTYIICTPYKHHKRAASSLLFKLFQSNYTQSGTIKDMEIKVLMSVAKILAEGYIDLDTISSSFQKLSFFTSTMREMNEFTVGFDNVLEQVYQLVDIAKNIQEHKNDKETLSDLYYDFSISVSASPELRLIWLNSLALLHEKHNYLAEAAQCKLAIVSLIISHLRSRTHLNFPEGFENFELISPNLKYEPRIFYHQTVSEENLWSVREAISKLKEAIDLFYHSTQFELASKAYTIIDQIYEREKNFKEMVNNVNLHKELCQDLTTDVPPERIIPSYFRVGFYGEKWGNMNTKQFIYKRTIWNNLSTMKDELEKIYETQHGSDLVMLMTNRVDINNLDKDKLYIQIAGVSPYIPPEQLDLRIGHFKTHFNIDQFVFQTNHNTDGKRVAEDDLVNQYKKKTIFSTRYAFPYIKTRSEVVEEEEIILTPIQNAVELVTLQTSNIRAELSRFKIQINPLQQIIQGSVAPMVNVGPLRVAEIFLDPEKIRNKEFPTKDILALISALEDFLRFCFLALTTSNYTMEDKYMKFQEMVTQSFNTLKPTIESSLSSTKKILEELGEI